jgi:hypothetical protein
VTPYPADFGGYVIGALPYAGAEALRIFAWIAVPFAVLITVIAVVRRRRGLTVITAIRRHRAALAGLMDRGDGQGGVPPVARRLAQAEARTEAISMRDVTAMERVTPPCPQFCADLTKPGDGADCKCPAPCGRDWCTRKRELARNPVPVTWTEREEGVR